MVILPVQVPANRAAPVGFDFGLGGDFLGSAAGATVGAGVGLSSIGAGNRCAVITRSANAIKQKDIGFMAAFCEKLPMSANVHVLRGACKPHSMRADVRCRPSEKTTACKRRARSWEKRMGSDLNVPKKLKC